MCSVVAAGGMLWVRGLRQGLLRDACPRVVVGESAVPRSAPHRKPWPGHIRCSKACSRLGEEDALQPPPIQAFSSGFDKWTPAQTLGEECSAKVGAGDDGEDLDDGKAGDPPVRAVYFGTRTVGVRFGGRAGRRARRASGSAQFRVAARGAQRDGWV